MIASVSDKTLNLHQYHLIVLFNSDSMVDNLIFLHYKLLTERLFFVACEQEVRWRKIHVPVFMEEYNLVQFKKEYIHLQRDIVKF